VEASDRSVRISSLGSAPAKKARSAASTISIAWAQRRVLEAHLTAMRA
jgi:hypothetical protein